VSHESLSTPLRALVEPGHDRLRWLGATGLTYHDGGESHVLQILRGATDLSSSSDELVARAPSWETRYHVDPSRANVVRALALGKEDAVLEIGAGCGAITRYLGERCRLVDALEPMADRALCARERTRDLDNVEVFVGLVQNVPAKATYDVVVIMGVLEYVGGGSPERQIYADFLAAAARLLRPGGTLVLGIENRMGVKYLAGAPEDHSGRPFEGVEGYDNTSVARTFSRQELEAFFVELELSTVTLGVFPDYKLTRALIHDDLYDAQPKLAVTTPRFPSPDWNGGPPRVANEARMWRNLVTTGFGRDTANSLLVLGHRGNGPSALWPKRNLLTFFSPWGRRPAFAIESRVRRKGGELEVQRRRVVRERLAPGLKVRDEPEKFVEGRDLLEVIIESQSDDELLDLLQRWRRALAAAFEKSDEPHADLLPHNAIVTPAGHVMFIDSKWSFAGYDEASVVERAALLLSWNLALNVSPRRWSLGTVRELALKLGAMLEIPGDGEWIEWALSREAVLQASINTPLAQDTDDAVQVARLRRQMVDLLDASLSRYASHPMGDVVGEVAALEREIQRLQSTRLFRYSAIPRSAYYRLMRVRRRVAGSRQR
jgi:SAM-dependent methyltransferase